MTRTTLLTLTTVLAAHVMARGQTTRPVVTSPADVRGISWSDPRDNYNPAAIVPAHLAEGDPPAKAAAVADAVATRLLGIGGNTVRLGINPPTVADPTWWPTYRQAVRTLAGRGVCVILCAWEQSPTVQGNGRGRHDGRFGAGTVRTYAAMWKTVHAEFKDEPNVIGYELLNEPFGYRRHDDEYARDMRTLIDAVGPDLHGKHVILGGLGYSDDVQAVARLFPDPRVWLAYHVYPNWFGGEAGDTVFTRDRYAQEIADRLKGVEARTLISEFGCWGGPGYDYARPSTDQPDRNAARHVAYLHGVADACVTLKLGSIYWFADARESGARPAYDLFKSDGTVLDAGRLAEVRRAWRLSARGGPSQTQGR